MTVIIFEAQTLNFLCEVIEPSRSSAPLDDHCHSAVGPAKFVHTVTLLLVLIIDESSSRSREREWRTGPPLHRTSVPLYHSTEDLRRIGLSVEVSDKRQLPRFTRPCAHICNNSEGTHRELCCKYS